MCISKSLCVYVYKGLYKIGGARFGKYKHLTKPAIQPLTRRRNELKIGRVEPHASAQGASYVYRGIRRYPFPGNFES